MSAPKWLLPLGVVAAATLSSPHALAETYFNTEQAQKALFPEATAFELIAIQLTDADRAALGKVAKTRTPLPEKTLWRAKKGAETIGTFAIDDVYGKHEFITYAVALKPDGSVRGLEVMVYRETYGGQIRDAKWRAQFVGKTHGATLALDQDIVNISGATMSCLHVAEGVKRLLALHAMVLKSKV